MKRIFIVAVLLCMCVSDVIAENVIYSSGTMSLAAGDTGMCYGDSYYGSDGRYNMYICGIRPLGCNPSNDRGCKCDGLFAFGFTPSYLKNGQSFSFNNKLYYCCLFEDQETGKFVENMNDCVEGRSGGASPGRTVNPSDSGTETIEFEYANFDDEYPQMLIHKKGDTVIKVFECGNKAVCSERVMTQEYVDKGYKPDSCTVHGQIIHLNNRHFQCINSNGRDAFGIFKEISSENVCDSDTQFFNSKTGECVDKSKYVAISTTDMQKCFACENNDDFKICTINKCYLENANAAKCTSELKKSCLLSRN